jgi:hypothetical protein
VVRLDCHEVCVYETMFRAGFRLPFLPVVQEFLNYLDLAPHQIAPNAWRIFHACMVLWPLALGKHQQLSVREFLHLHRVHKNPGGGGVYNVQTRRGRLVQLETKYSSNRGWKNHFFFASGQWEFATSEKAESPRVPREMNILSKKGHKAPRLTPNEIAWVNDVLDWVKKHDSSMLFEVLCTVPRLMEFVYKPAVHAAVKITEDIVRVRFNPGPPTANIRGATPRKDQA